MRPIRLHRTLRTLPALAAGIIGCGGDGPTQPPAATRLIFTVQPTNVVAGSAMALAVRVTAQDAQGTTATGFTGNVTVAIETNPSGGTLSGTTTVAAVSGVATFSTLSIDYAGAGYILTATSGTLASAHSSGFNVTPAPASRLTFAVQPTNVVAGTAIAPAVQIAARDPFGNVDATYTGGVTVAIAANPAGGALSGTIALNANHGVATFADLSINKASTDYTLSASAAGLTGMTSTPFTVTSGAATALVFSTQPSTRPAGAAITPAVRVTALDAFGNTATGFTGSATVAIGTNPSGGTLSGTTGVAAVSGVATFSDLSIDERGEGYTLTATAVSLASATSEPFDVGLAFAAVSAGDLHTCGVTTTGAAYCWGANNEGQLGDGTTTDRTSPVPVLGGLTFAALSADSVHTCGVTTTGGAYCWGDNGAGELGDGTTTNRTSPMAVSGALTFGAVSVGEAHTCGITAGAAAYCWGGGGNGQLGNGATASHTSPVAVAGGLTFGTVSAGWYYNCAVATGAAAYCWGYNANGQLGDGTTTQQMAPVAVLGGLSFAGVDAARYHTCGVTTNGAAYCWGNNSDGELGDGSTTSHMSPVAVLFGNSFAAVTAGGTFGHSCGLTTTGAAYCWGHNGDGQLGDGTTIKRASPVPVMGGLTFARVSAGSNYTCGITISGAAYCWGNNSRGQLGDGTTTNRTSPALVVQ
jgi:alpha-tubulin suppressor-like RCC1 family protein